MIKKALIYVDTSKAIDKRPTAIVPISYVTLIKRIVIDCRRAGVNEVVIVLDRPNHAIENYLSRQKFGISVKWIAGDHWRDEFLTNWDSEVLVLFGDRLYDARALVRFVETNIEDFEAVSAVDLKSQDAITIADSRFAPNDGKLMAFDESLKALEHQIGAYILTTKAFAEVESLQENDVREHCSSLIEKGEGLCYDIGNGFVQPIRSRSDVKKAEKRILRYIYKETDGIHARWNKKLIRPFIRLVLKTPLTPNMISLVGVCVSLAAGYTFSLGAYQYYLLGAVLSYVSALVDHMDGSIARLKGKESAFGCYFEQFCDFMYYFSFATGMTVGLYHETNNELYLILGGAFFFGTFMSLLTLSYQRKEFAKNPSQLAGMAVRKLESASNPIFRFARKTAFLVRRPVAPYYIFIFSALDLLPVLLFLCVVAANLYWTIQLSSNKLFKAGAETS